MKRVALFVSTYVNKLDRKGRVSVPATWRSALVGLSFNGIACYPSLTASAIEGSGIDRVEEMSDRIETLEPLSAEHESLRSLFSEIRQLPFDGEGRVVLPEELVSYAGLSESAALVGLGRTFQIWEPEAHKRHQAEMRERIKRNGLTIPAPRPRPTPQGSAG